MKVSPECFPCFFRQSLIALDQCGLRGADRLKVLKGVAAEVSAADYSETPAHVTTFIHRRLRSATVPDPFRQIKSEYNLRSLAQEGALRDLARRSPDPLLTAARLSIAGNIIDFGIFTSVDVEGTVQRALEGPLDRDDYGRLREELVRAKRILFLLDNAGEIVFDRILIEEMLRLGVRDVTAVVKGSPVINDVLIDDAIQVGLEKVCRVIDNGSDAVGTILPWCSPGFNREFEDADLIISKGQGNFETLHALKGKTVYFLFQAKCDVVAREFGLQKGAMVLSRGDLLRPAGVSRRGSR